MFESNTMTKYPPMTPPRLELRKGSPEPELEAMSMGLLTLMAPSDE
jgi:hypothetical protein